MNRRNYSTDQQPQQQDPEHEKSPTKSGIFIAFVELMGAAVLLGIGVHFVTTPEEPDAVAWVAFVIIAVLVLDSARRIMRIARGKDLR